MSACRSPPRSPRPASACSASTRSSPRSTRSTPAPPTSRTSRRSAWRRWSPRATSGPRPRGTRCARSDAIIICLPTPLTEHREPDLSAVLGRRARAWPQRLRPGPAGGAREHDLPGHDPRRGWRRCWSAPACAPAATSTWPSRPSASTRAATDWTTAHHAEGVGRPHARVHPARDGPLRRWPARRWCRSASPEVAELTKLLENIFRSVNIALVNELAMLCDRMGIDVWEVIDAAATKPFGFMPFRPGPGPGRPLHPDRPLLPHLEGARVRLAHRVHRARGQDQLADARSSASAKVARALNSRRKALNGSRVLVIGVAYKADVDDMRESPALRIIELLRAEGARRGLPRPARAGAAQAGPGERRRWTPRRSARRRRGGRHRPRRASTGRWSRATRRWSWTCATSSRAPTARSGGLMSDAAR